jgi:type IV secretory pathway VirB10-like protein
MEISKTAVGVLAGLCILAGAGGAYFATRGSEPVDTSEVIEAPLVSPDPSASAVDESEAIVADDTATPAAPATAPAAPARRAAPARAVAPREPENRVAVARPSAAPQFDPQPAPAPSYEARVATPPALDPVQPREREREPEPEPVRAAAPPEPEFEELIVSADSVVGLQVETSISSERARVEDEVLARVTRDVRVGDRVAIPAGATAHGEVTLVERGGRLKDRARLGIRFTSVVLADGTRIPLETDTIYREGDAPSGESAAKIGGGAIGGAIIGGILGGARGAVIGGSAGAGAGTAAVLAGGRNPATLPTGTPVTVRVTKPTTVTVEK